jgi:2-C-methyl-D-erythritol 2,4-cyclodiphosphate synthase
MNIRIGQGIDFHRLEEGIPLFLGGVRIISEKGCVAHSDGDVLLHAICDALLGAAGLRDIGYYFPDTEAEYKDIDSKILLGKTLALVKEKGFMVINIDTTLCLEKPRIANYIPQMRDIISALVEIESDNVSIKATTTEKLGSIGREEGIVALAVVLLSK